jgi:DNA-binding CsgD family transcriptional regulator
VAAAGDYQAVLAIVAEAAWGTAAEPIPRDVLRSIRRLIPAADVVAYFEGAPWARLARRRWLVGDVDEWSPEEKAIADRFRFQVPLGPSPATVGQAIRISDRMNLRQYRGLDLYNLAGRAHHIEYAMDCWLVAPNGISRGFTFDAARRDLNDRDRDVAYVLGRFLARVVARFDGPLPPTEPIGPLTPRQAQIVALAAAGLSNAAIADRLSVSPHTVRKHLENAFALLGVHSRTAAAVAVTGKLAERTGITGTDDRPTAQPVFPSGEWSLVGPRPTQDLAVASE